MKINVLCIFMNALGRELLVVPWRKTTVGRNVPYAALSVHVRRGNMAREVRRFHDEHLDLRPAIINDTEVGAHVLVVPTWPHALAEKLLIQDSAWLDLPKPQWGLRSVLEAVHGLYALDDNMNARKGPYFMVQCYLGR
jgi:hypothetical protein